MPKAADLDPGLHQPCCQALVDLCKDDVRREVRSAPRAQLGGESLLTTGSVWQLGLVLWFVGSGVGDGSHETGTRPLHGLGVRV